MPRLLVTAAAFFALVLPLLGGGDGRTPSSAGLLPGNGASEVLVRLRPAALAQPDGRLGRALGGEVVERLNPIGVVRLRLTTNETADEAIERLNRLPFVEAAEPNHRLRTSLLPNDRLFGVQSGYLALIEAPPAWDIEAGDDSVLVAVLDSGVDIDHPDLAGRVWTNPLEIAGNGIDDDNNGCVDDRHGCNFVIGEMSDPACEAPAPAKVHDDNGHGTFVAGIIAAAGNNSVGVTGVAPGVTLLPVKILDCTGGGTAAGAAQAILYAARSGARVTNLSFGAEGESQTLASAIREAHDRYGMIIVAPTGNGGSDRVGFPARLPQTIAVASSGTAADPEARSPFSDWGREVAFAAPGTNIVSTVPGAACGAWLCLQDEPYAVASGTSFAAPFVSGLAALIVSRYANLSPAAVRAMIAATARDLPDGATPNWDGAGRIRMRPALSLPRFSIGAAGIAKD